MRFVKNECRYIDIVDYELLFELSDYQNYKLINNEIKSLYSKFYAWKLFFFICGIKFNWIFWYFDFFNVKVKGLYRTIYEKLRS